VGAQALVVTVVRADGVADENVIRAQQRGE
jgi:hypothetical protein